MYFILRNSNMGNGYWYWRIVFHGQIKAESSLSGLYGIVDQRIQNPNALAALHTIAESQGEVDDGEKQSGG